jgi:Tfp pilus assembly protein PilN
VSTAQKNKINLLPKGALEKTAVGKILNWGLVYGRYIIIFTELVVVVCFLVRFKLDRDLDKVNKEIKQKQQTVTSYEKFEKEFLFLRDRFSSIKKIDQPQNRITHVIPEINKLMPVSVILDKFNVNEKKVTLEGTAFSTDSLRTLLAKLRNSENFNRIELISLSSGGNQNPNLKFSLEVVYTQK